MEYQPVVVQRHARPAVPRNPESRYWRQFKSPVFVKEYAPVTSIHFSPSKPHRFAVTSATRVQIYAPRTQKIVKTISRFKDVARSGNIRGDGKLVVAGDDSGLVQLFDLSSRAVLRTLDSHKQPVHVAAFSPLNQTHVLSCSDDTTVKLWDVPSEQPVHTFTDHTDYVRTGLCSPIDPNVILTGSYDATVRLWDARTGECEMILGGPDGGGNNVDGPSTSKGVNTLPVERILMFPTGTAVLSASGPILRIWDLVAGGRCMRALSNHQKTITSLAFSSGAGASGEGRGQGRLLTGGLDQMVKVYDLENYKVVHTMRYPAPVLCLAISPDDTHIAAGMTDGTLSIRRRQPKASESTDPNSSTDPFTLTSLRVGTYQAFLSNTTSSIGLGHTRPSRLQKSKPIGDADELRIESRRRKKLKPYDRLLKSFKYSAALDSVLRKQTPPTIAFSVIQELIARDGLKSALGGRDDVLLEPVLTLLVKYVADPRFGELVCGISIVVLDMYAPVLGQSPLIDALFLRLRKNVHAELKFQNELVKIRGALDMLFTASAMAA